MTLDRLESASTCLQSKGLGDNFLLIQKRPWEGWDVSYRILLPNNSNVDKDQN